MSKRIAVRRLEPDDACAQAQQRARGECARQQATQVDDKLASKRVHGGSILCGVD